MRIRKFEYISVQIENIYNYILENIYNYIIILSVGQLYTVALINDIGFISFDTHNHYFLLNTW